VRVQRQVLDLLAGLARASARLDLAQAVADEPDAVDQQPVGRPLDLKVAEEGVGAEEREHLVQDVVRLGVGVGRLVRGQRRVGEGEGVDGPADLGAEGEEREVADQAGGVGVGVEDGVVGLEGEGGCQHGGGRGLGVGRGLWSSSRGRKCCAGLGQLKIQSKRTGMVGGAKSGQSCDREGRGCGGLNRGELGVAPLSLAGSV